MARTSYSRELRKLTLFYTPKPKDKTVFESLYTSIRSKKPRRDNVTRHHGFLPQACKSIPTL